MRCVLQIIQMRHGKIQEGMIYADSMLRNLPLSIDLPTRLATQKNTLYLSQISKGVCISFSSDTTDKITYYRDNEETPT